jgi:PAS domain S-box-containing protein/putative nucleotidyltransferase with HDIG domain
MAKGRILVVEDEAIVALDIQSRLLRLGYELAGHAASGREAVDLAAARPADLVLMDVQLPGEMDGIEAARQITEKSSLPVIYLTAMSDQATLDRAKGTKPYGYLAKPFEDHELSLTIEMALYKFQAEQRLQESERLLSTTLGSLGEAVLSLNPAGSVTYLNPAAERLLGVDAAMALGGGYASLMRVLDEESREPISDLEELCSPSPRHPHCEDMLLVTSAGREVPVAMSVTPVMGPRGGLKGRVLVLRDVTLRKRAETEVKRSMSELRTTFRQTVRALASMAEKRDPYTAGHQQRVARLACAIGRDMGLSEDALEGLEMAGILHDVGKVYVPAEILSKPARLSQMEMGIMKTHPEVGFEILREVSFPWPVARAVLEHHERMDGSGYPAGLHGHEISLEARILAVSDVVEAMSSHRPYRAALGLARALDEIKSGRGRGFEPDAVDVCLHLFDGGGFSFEAPASACPEQGAPRNSNGGDE